MTLRTVLAESPELFEADDKDLTRALGLRYLVFR